MVEPALVSGDKVTCRCALEGIPCAPVWLKKYTFRRLELCRLLFMIIHELIPRSNLTESRQMILAGVLIAMKVFTCAIGR
jgi:hypothetical protein